MLALRQQVGVEVLKNHHVLLEQVLQLKILAAASRSRNRASDDLPTNSQGDLDRPKEKFQLARNSVEQELNALASRAESPEENLFATRLLRAWSETKEPAGGIKTALNPGNYDHMVELLLDFIHESAVNYQLHSDTTNDLNSELISNTLPGALNALTNQNVALIDPQSPRMEIVTKNQQILAAHIAVLRSAIKQLKVLQNTEGDLQTEEFSQVPPIASALVISDKVLVQRLEKLVTGLMAQQDFLDFIQDAQVATPVRIGAVDKLRSAITDNSELAQSAIANATEFIGARVAHRLSTLRYRHKELVWTLWIGAFVIAYLLYGFYIGTLKSINALKRGTNAFCAGQIGVRIKLKSRDELQQLAINFNLIAQEAERLVQTIETQNQTRERELKVLVDALGSKNEELYAINHRVHEELNLARSVQLAILPQQFPNEPTWSAHACMHPARELGGDFYDCFALPDGRYGVLVADVSGKGVGAAFFMAVSRTVLLDSALSVRAPAQVLALANELLCARNPMDLFVTACLGLFDPQDGSFEFASAGHPPPLVRRHGGVVETLPTTKDMALGVFKDMQYNEHITRLQPGDTLLMYTDGVTEAFSPQEVAYGEERLLSWFAASSSDGTAAQLVDHLVRDVASFVDGAEASDDLTCLILCSKRAGWRGPRSSY
jgi:serine phosphatase RsbU (regulator of sigma subunit)